MSKFTKLILVSIFLYTIFSATITVANPPIYIAFHWHMHQPIYWPYEDIYATEARGAYSYSVLDIHRQRIGPYTTWPKDAVQMGIDNGLGHLGAQVSISGSLIENLNSMEAHNDNFVGWKNSWNYIRAQRTTGNNPRIDLVAFGYHHPLMGLIDYQDIRKQIQLHRDKINSSFTGASYSKGIFPPENAFADRMIPALVDEGIEWVMVDNIHFDRACQGYPWNSGGNIYEPNPADQLNPNPNDWVQLNNLWAPTKVSAGWGHRPHYVQYIDPNTGIAKKMIAVPTSRYLGNEDGRGGFGALNYESVMSQLEFANTDASHPILIVLHHDGDNYGGGSDQYYHSNFSNFVNWLKANPSRFVCTTIQDYLDMFPPDPNDIIHTEPGSWSGADNGDPEFLKWNGNPGPSGYSSDRNSWSIVTAAKNRVLTADAVAPTNPHTINAWKFLTNSETSCYWYWDGTEMWDSHPARACNQAVAEADQVIGTTDPIGPTIYIPQREPYNPGGTEWGIQQPSDFTVWTFVYDVSGLASVTLKYRTDKDGINSTSNNHNETYTGGTDVNNWVSINMTSKSTPSLTNPLPTYKADEYSALITGIKDSLVDYYVEAQDNKGNITKSPIQHVWVGKGGGSGGGTGLSWLPTAPTINDSIVIKIKGATQGGKLHWGVNNWQLPNQVYWPQGTVAFGDGKSVETPFVKSGDTLRVRVGPFNNPVQSVNKLDFVIHYDDNTWDNNGGQDWHLTISGSSGGTVFIMDGSVDASANLLSSNNGIDLYAGWNGKDLYVATQSASSQSNDMFIFVSDAPGSLRNHPWAKPGQVANFVLYLANESTNSWCGWQDANATTITTGVFQATGAYLEGTVDVNSKFVFPTKLYLAVGKYGTDNSGTLLAQVPAGNGDGNIDANEFYEFSLTSTGVNPIRDAKVIPTRFALHQNYPNPFNTKTVISYRLPIISNQLSPITDYRLPITDYQLLPVNLSIYNLAGQLIQTLVNEKQQPGEYQIEWNTEGLPSGIYFYRLTAGNFAETKKLILMK